MNNYIERFKFNLSNYGLNVVHHGGKIFIELIVSLSLNKFWCKHMDLFSGDPNYYESGFEINFDIPCIDRYVNCRIVLSGDIENLIWIYIEDVGKDDYIDKSILPEIYKVIRRSLEKVRKEASDEK